MCPMIKQTLHLVIVAAMALAMMHCSDHPGGVGGPADVPDDSLDVVETEEDAIGDGH